MMKEIKCDCVDTDCKRVLRIYKDLHVPEGKVELLISDKSGTFLLNSGIFIDENLINLSGVCLK